MRCYECPNAGSIASTCRTMSRSLVARNANPALSMVKLAAMETSETVEDVRTMAHVTYPS